MFSINPKNPSLKTMTLMTHDLSEDVNAATVSCFIRRARCPALSYTTHVLSRTDRIVTTSVAGRSSSSCSHITPDQKTAKRSCATCFTLYKPCVHIVNEHSTMCPQPHFQSSSSSGRSRRKVYKTNGPNSQKISKKHAVGTREVSLDGWTGRGRKDLFACRLLDSLTHLSLLPAKTRTRRNSTTRSPIVHGVKKRLRT